MRKTNGFSLIELMIALGILTIIATVAVPKVQVWNARNRGLQAVVEILSDFSKARSIAGYTVVGDKTNGKIEIPVDISKPEGNKMPVYIGIRLQTAMVFRAHEYAIYQKESMKVSDWKNATVLKKNKLPESVSIVKINNFGNITGTEDADDVSRRIVFTSNGLVKTQSDGDNSGSETLVGGKNDTTPILPVSCGGNSAPMSNLVFAAVVKSKIGGSGDAVWYRLEIDQTGEYYICMAFPNSSTNDQSTIFGSGNVLSI